LERKFEGYDEGIVDQRQNSSLGKDMGDFTWALGDVRFADGLECIYSTSVLLFNHHHFAKAPFANDLQEIKRFDGERLILSGPEVDLEVEGAGTGRGRIPFIGGVLKRAVRYAWGRMKLRDVRVHQAEASRRLYRATNHCPYHPDLGRGRYGGKQRRILERYGRHRLIGDRGQWDRLRIDVINAQVSAIVPDRVVEIAVSAVDENLVLVELEDDIWEPPVSFALHAFSVTDLARRCLERFEDAVGNGSASGQVQASP
jgi:hypothetical protein